MKFPFSKSDIYEIAHALHDYIEKIYMLIMRFISQIIRMRK
jgi:hypothetical protein